MTGYQEVVTDPSYSEQIVAFTAPMVGNYGVLAERSESTAVHARAVVMRAARGPAWTEWLGAHGIPALSGVDTRSVVLHAREKGSMRAAVVCGEASIDVVVEAVRARPRMSGLPLVANVSTAAPYVYAKDGHVNVALLDCGCKRSILRRLVQAGAAVTVFPNDTDAQELTRFDGVVLSNGPGDPEPLRHEVQTVQDLLGRVPILGICLGHQLLALATGLRTFKLPFGHRGANHPVLERITGRVLVTSQNHGFAVTPAEGNGVTHVSLYDGTVEGLEFPGLRARSVQFHPEAGPGPHDGRFIIERWVDELRDAKAA
jgi:carbamoyl-phosphate synthase small subunit